MSFIPLKLASPTARAQALNYWVTPPRNSIIGINMDLYQELIRYVILDE